jgi:cysteine synthase
MPVIKSEKIQYDRNVPLVRLKKIETVDSAAIYAKLEAFNPGGSVKIVSAWP